MNLIKKTVILTSGAAEGYVSVIRVGDDIGAKIVGANFEKGMRAGIKVGRSDIVYALLDGPKTELTLNNVNFHNNDNISCTVLKGDKVVARGGTAVRAKDIINYFDNADSSNNGAYTELVSVAAVPEENPQSAETDINPDNSIPENNIAESETDNIAAEGNDDNRNDEEKTDGVRSILEKLSAKDGAEFYNGVREKIDELFVIHPKEELLSALIPDSEWVKIIYDGDDYYVVGKIFENERPVLLGYGVPGKKSVTPPKIADEISSWLTVNGLNNGYDGYWLIFQDAVTGKVTNAN